MDYTHRLDEHLKRWEQGQEEMVEVPKGYLEWLKAENERLREAIIVALGLMGDTVNIYITKARGCLEDALKAGEDE